MNHLTNMPSDVQTFCSGGKGIYRATIMVKAANEKRNGEIN